MLGNDGLRKQIKYDSRTSVLSLRRSHSCVCMDEARVQQTTTWTLKKTLNNCNNNKNIVNINNKVFYITPFKKPITNENYDKEN